MFVDELLDARLMQRKVAHRSHDLLICGHLRFIQVFEQEAHEDLINTIFE